MRISLKEKIGNPELFTGRKRELDFYLKWTTHITRESSQSSAILSRRKTGKTALLQRLYNITFEKNMGVIPFYYEVKEGKQWVVDFCRDFYLTFLYQYIAFRSRKPEYVDLSRKPDKDFVNAGRLACQEELDYLLDSIQGVQRLVEDKNTGLLWDAVRETPWILAMQRKESIVQIVDEFQYLNSEMYWDEAKTNLADDLASGYMRTAEYKNAPLLVSGSWVGWLSSMLNKMTGRFQMDFLEPLPEHEAVETVFKYALLEDIPVTEATAYLITQSCEGNPAYIGALMRSRCPNNDLTTENGVLQALEFETLDERGSIKNTWKEYLQSALPRVNAVHAKQIILYLCKYKEQQILRRDLLRDLNLPMTEEELERKMEILIRADIVEHGRTNARYQAVRDSLFDKVFRGMYAEDIEAFDPREITNEYKALFETARRKYRQLLGKYSQAKGAFAEYQILKKLRTAYRQPDMFRSMIYSLPEGFEFVEYESVWSYYGTAQGRPDFQVDIFAHAANAVALIGEIKNRDNAPFTAP
ncbi:MAG: hypothetical protein GY801_31830, partial [bacterium]|nr:hypothetical protein [bacterium]